jgi:RNA polymerase sigma-70 factor (ECF subfamily)
VIVHRASKLIRKRRLLRRLGLARDSLAIEPDSLIAPSAPVDVAAELRKLYGVLEQLPAHLRVALVLRRVEGLSLDEVAELTQTSLATVKRRITEAERLLKARTSRESP